MAFWCNGKNGFCDKNNECSMSCEHFDGNGGEERETLENQTDAANDTPRWISVKEDLPASVIAPYLVCCDGQICLADWSHDKWEDNWWFYVDGEYEPLVTHWMPLPEPPKEAEDANR